MFNRLRNNAQRSPDEESPWISFTDLMAGFLVVILLALTAAIIMLTLEKSALRKERETVGVELENAKKAADAANAARDKAQTAQKDAENEKDKMINISTQLIGIIKEIRDTQREIVGTISKMDDYDRSRKEMLKAIRDRLATKGIQVEISKVGDVLHISENNLSFALGSYKIENRFRPKMKMIGSEVVNQLQSSRLGAITDTVFVEGHTDNVRNRKERGNWGLSADRAISLWKFWEESDSAANKMSRLKNQEGKSLFSVTGYGETRPREVFAADSGVDQRVNRRIDLRFNLQAAKSDLLKRLSSQVNETLEKIETVHKTVRQQIKDVK